MLTHTHTYTETFNTAATSVLLRDCATKIVEYNAVTRSIYIDDSHTNILFFKLRDRAGVRADELVAPKSGRTRAHKTRRDLTTDPWLESESDNICIIRTLFLGVNTTHELTCRQVRTTGLISNRVRL